ncbi:DUF6049 family protein [Herbidospora sp. NBRC 101105]|uniref:DUF6049 family protein n=1 Tax=Herbidospora sp. NBRC 101105 TaxID=3032195 RepID=UPI002557211A|nr:DUF6049 family protein [Herbidospora sp. NBRC 101105]
MRRLGPVLFAFLLAGAGLAIPAAPTAAAATARAADPVTLSEFSPESPTRPDQTITIAGAVTGTPQSFVRVQIRYAAGRPFTSRADIASYVTGQTVFTNSWRTKVQATQVDGSGKLPFTLSLSPAELSISQPGVYPLEVEAVDAATEQVVGVERTFLTYVPKGTAVKPTRLALALPLTAQPKRADDQTFVDDDLFGDGRLNNLLALATATDETATWFVDGSVLDDAQRVSRPYYLDGAAKEAVAQGAEWVTSLRSALADNPVMAMPYADADLGAIVHNGLDTTTPTALLVGSFATNQLLKVGSATTSTIWPVGGVIDRDTLDALAVNGVDTVLLAQAAVPPQATAALAGSAGVVDTVSGPVIVQTADPVLSGLLGTDGRAAGATVAARQRYIAETAMNGLTANRAAPLIAMPSNHLWNPDPTFMAALLKPLPWVRDVPLASIRPAKNASVGDLVYPPQARQAELPKSYMSGVRRLARTAEVAMALPTSGQRTYDRAVLRLTSASWRGGKKAPAFARQLNSAITKQMDRVFIVGADDPFAVAGTNGRILVTVRNTLRENVKFNLEVRSRDPDQLQVEARGGVFVEKQAEVQAGKAGTYEIPVVVPADHGKAAFDVQLLTADGRKYGKPTEIVISATGYTGIALVIVGVAVTIMLAAVVMRLLRRHQRKDPVFPAPVQMPVEQEEPQGA